MNNRPNIVMFVTDQQRADTLPGRSPVDVHAPHAAWLMQHGITYDRAYCTAPICTPARTSLMTGRYPHETGVVANYQHTPRNLSLPEDVPTVAQYLGEAGYRCAYTGKWHIPTWGKRPGFDDHVTRLTHWDIDDVTEDDAITFGNKVGVDVGAHYTAYLRGDASPSTTDGGQTKLPLAFHPSTQQALEAAAYIRRMAQQDEPYLLVYSCIEPHPLGLEYNISPAPFDRMYDPGAMPLPTTRRDPNAPQIVRKRDYKGLVPTDHFSDDQLREMVAGYYGAVSYVDHLMGLLLEALIATDQFDNTMFIFTSDHGEMLGDHRMLKKGPVMFEELARIPLVIKPPAPAPGSRDGQTSSSLVSHVDLLPTMLAVAGLESDLPGHDLFGDAPSYDGIALEYHSTTWGQPAWPLRAWVTDEWKYVETVGGDDELYNLKDDPNETRNLIHTHETPRRAMQDALRAWQREHNDEWPDVAQPAHALPAPTGEWARLVDNF